MSILSEIHHDTELANSYNNNARTLFSRELTHVEPGSSDEDSDNSLIQVCRRSLSPHTGGSLDLVTNR